MSGRLALALLLLAAAACSGDDDADPSPTTAPTSSTTVVDLSGVALPGVGGETTTTIDDTGTARLVGTVTGPTGPVAGATVRIDRLVAGREVRHDVTTGGDGRWELTEVPGGRYRVRAFLAPVYAQTAAEVRFLADGAEHAFDLVVEDQRGVVVRADVAPDQPTVDDPVNLVVLVVQHTVDADGIVRATPLSGVAVELTGLGRWILADDPLSGDDTTSTTFTEPASPIARLSSTGTARFELRCVSAGPPGLSLDVPVTVDAAPGAASTTSSTEPLVTVETVALDLPACVARGAPASTTTTAAAP